MGLANITTIRKQEIVRAFYETAKSEGVENTSFAKIAKTLEIQPSLIVHYFKSKDDLVLALIEYCLELYLKIFDEIYLEKKEPEKRLKVLLDRLFSKDWNELFDDGVYYSAYALIFRDASIQDKFKNLHNELREKLSSLLEECNQKNIITIDCAKGAANQIFSLVDGTYFYINMIKNPKEQQLHLKSSEKLAIELLNFKS